MSPQDKRSCWRRPTPGCKSLARSTKALPPPASGSPRANSPVLGRPHATGASRSVTREDVDSNTCWMDAERQLREDFEAFYRMNLEVVLAFCFARTGDAELAAD